MAESGKRFRFANWNAHSVLNKRQDIEAMLSLHDLDMLCVTEIWLASEHVFELFGYLTFRCDRCLGRGGGALNLIRSELAVTRMDLPIPCGDAFEAVGLTVRSPLGVLAVVCAYMPPGSDADLPAWRSVFSCVPNGAAILFCGDLNAHSGCWGSLCTNPQCDAAIARRRAAIKEYLRDQTRLAKAAFRRVDEEVKRFLRSPKSESFRSYCEALSPPAGLGNIWRTVRSMPSRRVSRCSGVTNAPDSPEFRALQDELVQPWRAPVDLPRIEFFDESDVMNAPFSSREFSAALASCGVHTAPGLDGVEYRVVRGLSSLSHEFLLALFNRMFRDSLFPESWRGSLVVLIPKTGSGKFRPIFLTTTLCKLFERLVQRRVEHLAEFGDWIPPNQYGFRRGRFSLDCVAAVVCDFLSGFGTGESSYAIV